MVMSETPWVGPAYKYLTERKTGDKKREFDLAFECLLSDLQREVLAHFKSWQQRDRGDDGKWRSVCSQALTSRFGSLSPQQVNSEREDALIALGYRWSNMDKRCQRVLREEEAALAILKQQIDRRAAESVSGIMKALDEATNTLVLLTGSESRFSSLSDAIHEIKKGGKDTRTFLIRFAEEFRRMTYASASKDGARPFGRRQMDVLLANTQELLATYLGEQQENLRLAIQSFLAAIMSSDALTVEVALRALLAVFHGRLDSASDTEVLVDIKRRQQYYTKIMREFPEHEKRIVARKEALDELFFVHGDRIAECGAELSGILERIASIQDDVKKGPDVTDPAALLAFAEKAKELGYALKRKDELKAYLGEWSERVASARQEIADLAAELEAYRAYYDDAKGFFSEVAVTLDIPNTSSVPQTSEPDREFTPVWVSPTKAIPDELRATVNSWRAEEILGHQLGFWVGVRDQLGLDNATFLEALASLAFLDDVKASIRKGVLAFEHFNVFKVAYDATRKLPIFDEDGKLRCDLLFAQHEQAVKTFGLARETRKTKRTPAGA